MSGLARIGLFGALLALVFAGAALAGSVLDPDPGQATESDDKTSVGHAVAHGSAQAADGGAAGTRSTLPGRLARSRSASASSSRTGPPSVTSTWSTSVACT
jgi:hypothetical protein